MELTERADLVKKMLEQISRTGSLGSIAKPAQIVQADNTEVFLTGEAVSDTAIEKLATNALNELSGAELYHLEAIVLPLNRPAVFVRGTSYDDLPDSWGFLNTDHEIRARIGSTFLSIGRIDLPNSPLVPYGGTGFVVGEGLMMTNRHVAQLFSRGLGLDILYTPGDAEIGFTHEIGEKPGANPLRVCKVELIHPYWDMALLRVEGLTTQKPLQLYAEDPAGLIGEDIVVVGYPALDPRNDFALQNQVFGQTFNVKRLQPGTLRPLATIRSFENVVNALTHDASTLGGNSGSAVIHIKTGSVIALHFAGEYLKANFAVPMHDLARDLRLSDKLKFKPSVLPTRDFDAAWRSASDGKAAPATSPLANDPEPVIPTPIAVSQSPFTTSVPPGIAAGIQPSLSFTLPLHISVTAGPLISGAPPALTLSTATAQGHTFEAEEGVVIDQDYSDREGYDPKFLDGFHVPLPVLSPVMKKATVEVPAEHRKHGDPYELVYHHYSVYMNQARRTAWFSAANIDGNQRPSIGKRQGDRWYVDTRIPKTVQLTQNAFEHGIDRGHLTRREDTAWGKTLASALKANNDTFHFTNCSLQAAMFNRGKDRWQGLEQFLLEKHAKPDKRRMIVITGPLFASNDPVYQNDQMGYSVRCPLQFWKVCVLVREDGSPATTGFILGQNEITDLPGFTEAFDVGVAQISIADLEKKTRLSFGGLAIYDHFAQSGRVGELEVVAPPVFEVGVKAIRNAGDIEI